MTTKWVACGLSGGMGWGIEHSSGLIDDVGQENKETDPLIIFTYNWIEEKDAVFLH